MLNFVSEKKCTNKSQIDRTLLNKLIRYLVLKNKLNITSLVLKKMKYLHSFVLNKEPFNYIKERRIPAQNYL